MLSNVGSQKRRASSIHLSIWVLIASTYNIQYYVEAENDQMAKLVQADILNISGRCQKEAETWDQSLEINLPPFWGIFGLPAFVSNDQLTCFRKAPSSQKKNGFFSCLTKSEWQVLPNRKYFKRIYQKVVGEQSRPPEQVMKVWTFEKKYTTFWVIQYGSVT